MRRYFQRERRFFSVPLNYVFMNIWLLVKPSLPMAVGLEKVLNQVDGHKGSDCQLAVVNSSLCGLVFSVRFLGWFWSKPSAKLSLFIFRIYSFILWVLLFPGCPGSLCRPGRLSFCWAGCSLGAVGGLLTAAVSLALEHGRVGMRASAVAARGLWCTGSVAVVLGLTCFSVCVIFLLQGLNGVPALQGRFLTPGPLGSSC